MFEFELDDKGNLTIKDIGLDMSVIYTDIPAKDVVRLKKLLEGVK